MTYSRVAVNVTASTYGREEVQITGVIMQTNPNKENKNIVEIYDWKDSQWEYNPWFKKYNRRLRRKRQKRLLDKTRGETILKA